MPSGRRRPGCRPARSRPRGAPGRPSAGRGSRAGVSPSTSFGFTALSFSSVAIAASTLSVGRLQPRPCPCRPRSPSGSCRSASGPSRPARSCRCCCRRGRPSCPAAGRRDPTSPSRRRGRRSSPAKIDREEDEHPLRVRAQLREEHRVFHDLLSSARGARPALDPARLAHRAATISPCHARRPFSSSRE